MRSFPEMSSRTVYMSSLCSMAIYCRDDIRISYNLNNRVSRKSMWLVEKFFHAGYNDSPSSSSTDIGIIPKQLFGNAGCAVCR